ncbi:DUF4365 domain-containing protein [Pedobacter soli]|uniref:DUF4365 domain-containing protein n=1 Tax=Pedobacter soli TaxID=390242 RepID=A0A1G6WMK0_9SPHI|nr:DUF4365 domain-containing protein [Pedobacter soli]SDD66265.1 protein of unknown function [Pedobacter soli]
MAKGKKTTNSRTTEEIQESGNILLDNVLELIRTKYQDLKINKTSEEHQKDRGVDFQIELISKPNENTLDMFKLQVKATDEPVTPLKTTANRGLISFQIDNRHIRYYQQEMPWALLFLLCDNSTKTVYWYAIQLDSTLEDRLNESIAKKSKSIQIFIDPKNILKPDSFLDFIRDAEASKTSQFFRVSEGNVNALTAGTDFQVDRGKPLLEQLFTLLEYLFEEVQYLPMHLLTQYYPFKISDAQSSFYQQFKLYTDNDDLVKMLDTFKVQPDGKIVFTDSSYIQDVEDYEKKAKAVLVKFTQNHIYEIVSQKSRKEVSTRYFSHGNCNCVVCCYNRLEIPQTIEKLAEPKNKSLDDQMKIAYMHYELGNYLKAVQAFQKIGKQAFNKGKKTLFLITQFNLIKLGRLIKSNYYDYETMEHGKQLMEINLDQAVYSARNRSHHRKLFNYIKDVRFYSDSAYEIQTAISKLRSEYQSFIGGGSFNTHSYDQLLNGFAQLSSFIGGNWIVYDSFGEFSLQMEEFTEGIFIALALRETNSYVISEFNDYHIQRLIFDGQHKVTWRYFNKYHFKSIPYKGKDGKFFGMISNLLANHHLVDDAYKAYSPEEGAFWRNPYPEVFNNCLCLAAMIEMNDKQVENITKAIMSCLSKADLPGTDAYAQVNSFFSSKRYQLSTNMLKELITFFLQKKDMYLEKRLGVFTAELKTREQIIKLSALDRKQLFKYALEGDRDLLQHFNTLAFFHPVADKSLKKEIKKRITSQLHIKFDAYHYYYAAITDVLSFQESEFLDKFIAATYPDPDKFSFRNTFYGPQDNEYPLFDMFFNLCFKFGLHPSEITDRKMEGFGEYYDWLLDLHGFDYDNFKISWLGLYPTKFYLRAFAKPLILRKTIEGYLRNNRDLQVERLYFDIYNPQDDGIELDFD